MYFGPSISVGRRGVSYGDSDAQAFIAATGLTGTTEVNAVNNLVANLKSYGLWSKMKAIYPFVSDTYNMFSYTEDFTNGYYGKTSLSVTANTTTAPNGTTTADTVTVTGTSDNLLRAGYGASSFDSNVYQTTSIYVKKGNARWFKIRNIYASDGVGNAWFDLDNGTLGTIGSGQTATITSVGNGWYRLTLTAYKPTGATNIVDFSVTANNGSNQGNVNDFTYIWGSQVQVSATATTYQPIATTPANRFVSQFKYNLKDARDLDAAFRLAFNGTWTYSKQGATPNGVNGFANTYLNATTVFTDKPLGFGVYVNTATTFVNDKHPIGAFSGSTNYASIQINNANAMTFNMFAASATSMTASPAATGHMFLTNNGTTVNAYVRTQTASGSLNGTNRPNQPFSIGGINVNGTTSQFVNNQFCAGYICDSLNATEAGNLYTTIQTYQTELSRYVGVPIVSDANAQAFLDAAVITDQTQANAVNTLVTDLKTYGLWTKMKAIYPFVSDTNNLLSYTTDYSNAFWTKTAITLTQNAGTAPDGTNTANKITETAVSSGHWLKTASTLTAGLTYTVSGYFKAAERQYAVLIDDDAGVHTAFFNLSTGTLVSQSGYTSTSITSVGNGWYRCSATRNAATVVSNYYWATSSNGSTYNYLGDGTSGIFTWGFQFEQGALTTYQPIATTPANRFVSQFKYNLKDARDLDAAFRLAFNGTWTYSKQGATPNGVNAYADTYSRISADFTAGSVSFSYYSRSNTTAPTTYTTEIGVGNGTPNLAYYELDLKRASGAAQVNMSDGFVNYINYTNADSTGYYIGNRNGASVLNLWKNNTKVASNTTASTFTYLPTNNILIAAAKDGASAIGNYSNRQTAFATLGAGLSDTEAINLYTAVNKFQTSLSRNV
jgi:hypothetical protein